MKIIIAGGRDFDDYDHLSNALKDSIPYHDHPQDIEIVSGAARGADKLGEKYATENNHQLTRFPADWGTHGKAAGHIRNREMAECAHMLVAFWDGKSRGTKNMIDTALKERLIVHVYPY